MSRPLRLPLCLAACAVTGIVGLLLTNGLGEWPLLGLVALPLLAAIHAWWRRNVNNNLR